ncbi:cation:proton antiporter [Pseudoduganella sp. OTU4001]|uniref:cation:proton antiporter n=1 Tax=Pseudoduganella sp. OTU4001 TaxID=3043854 RepID=UPI00313ED537
MSNPGWALLAGLILIAMMLTGTLLSRLPLSGAMVYLVGGMVLGPLGISIIDLHPIKDAATLELMTEIALLISLFSVGLKLEVPILDRRWIAPYRLAFISMTITVALIAAIGVYGLAMPLGVAVLLGGILAPTDPVLATAIQAEPGAIHDTARFSLAGEGALNDGTAFPLVLLGLGLMQLHDLGESGRQWWALDLLWSMVGGIAAGVLVGALLGKLVVYLRTRHQSATGLDEFLALGVIAISFGAAQLCHASGFLAVFFAGMALRSARNFPLLGTKPMAPGMNEPATHSHHASGVMTRAVLGFNEQLERIAELGIVLVVGAMLPYIANPASLWWFVPALFLVVRPLSVLLGMAGAAVPLQQSMLVGWLGIRGIGSVYYLEFALNHGVSGASAQQLVTLTLGVVAASILVHGVTGRPLMRCYDRRLGGG